MPILQSTITSFAGPMPTNFSPPPHCDGIYSGEIAYIDRAKVCLPRDYRPWADEIYSPGTACPTGYTAQEACSKADGVSRTMVTCCPVRAGITLGCVADPATLSGPFKNMLCTWSAGEEEKILMVTTFDDHNLKTMAVTMTGNQGVNAFGIRMVHDPSDFSTSIPTATSPITAMPTMADLVDMGKSSSGISTDAKIAIVAMVPLILLGIGFLAYFIYRRRVQASVVDTKHMTEGFKVFEDKANGNRMVMMMLPRGSRRPSSRTAVELPTDFNGTLVRPDPVHPS